MKVVDLFCGAGGMSLGFKQAGFEPVFAADFDKHSCSTYSRNLGPHVHCIDLASVDIEQVGSFISARCGEIDVVAGGPPCQGFSIQRRGPTTDDRNDLVKRFAEISVALKPKAIVMENVPTLLGNRGRSFVNFVTSKWREADYTVHQTILNAATFGVPQTRRRAFIVAVRNDLGAQFEFPQPLLNEQEYKTVRDAIGDLPPPPMDQTEHPDVFNHQRVGMSELNLKRISHVPEGGGRLDVPSDLQLACHKGSNGHRHLDVFGRLWWDRPAGTLTAMFDNFTRGRFAHPVEDRNITSREGARLQTFPDCFQFSGPKKDVARQIGNAVPPLLAKTLGNALMKALSETRPSVSEARQSVFTVTY